jgi:alpha-1,2-mannosyltransferase
MAVLGWQPVLAAVRDGQVSVLIGVLMIAGWAGMRERAGGGSGVAIGIAAALKLYPALLLALLALRRRAALVAALITMVASATIVSLIAGAQAWADFARAAAIIAASFAGEPHNLAVVARLAGVTPSGWLLAAYVATSVVMLLATIAVVLRRERSRAQCHTTDLEFALFISLAFLLSPVAWHHYVFMLAQPLAVALAAAITSRGRLAIGAWAAAVLLLSVPDDALRGFQAALPDHNVVLAAASPGAIVLLLWAMLLHLRRQSEERVLHRSRLAIGTI